VVYTNKQIPNQFSSRAKKQAPKVGHTYILQCNPPDTAYSEIRYTLQKFQFSNEYFIEKTKGPQQKDGHYDKM